MADPFQSQHPLDHHYAAPPHHDQGGHVGQGGYGGGQIYAEPVTYPGPGDRTNNHLAHQAYFQDDGGRGQADMGQGGPYYPHQAQPGWDHGGGYGRGANYDGNGGGGGGPIQGQYGQDEPLQAQAQPYPPQHNYIPGQGGGPGSMTRVPSWSSQQTGDPFVGPVGQGFGPDDDDGQQPLLGPGPGVGHHRFNRANGGDHGGRIGGFNPNVVGAQGAGQNFGGGGGGAGYNDDDSQSVVRYGDIPQRQPRRYKTVKRVQLYHGNLVLDCQVPPKLLERCPRKDEREFTHMRYTAATCDPDDFLDERYALRQILYEVPRRTELFIVLTMYNENEVLFCRTMHSVMKNIKYLCSRGQSKTWGADGWKKVVVCIVSDGRAKINKRTLNVLASIGVYQDGVAKNIVAGKPVTAHIYEYTTQISIDADLKFKSAEKGLVPVQVLFCLKEKNAKKINSHRWFFNAFGPLLQPNVCVLLDVGTKPGPNSIYQLWKTFDLNSNVGGACGEIVADRGKHSLSLLNPLVAAQNFEYKMSNILDKPLESVFGYITVLPGAFSAYRYIALQNDARGEGPLKEYFKGETLDHNPDADLWTKNMYLAEDRILCWELVAKRSSAWLLHYVRSAYAHTDVQEQVHDLIKQRRRWLNGSFFASLHSSFHFGYLYRSDHSIWRKFWLHIELFYQLFNMFFAWFGLGNYYIIFIILTQSLADPGFGLKDISYFNTVLKYIYIALVVMCFLLALGNRPDGSKRIYTVIMVCFAFITAYMTFAAVFITVRNVKKAESEAGNKFTLKEVFANTIFQDIVISLLSTYGLWLLASLIFFDPAHMVTSFLQYLLISPSYINVINVYAFCNVQDVTWGNRPEEKQSTDLGIATAKDGGVDVVLPTDVKDINAAYEVAIQDLKKKAPAEETIVDLKTKMTDSYAAIRTNVVLAWTLSNGALAAAILSTSAGSSISTTGKGSVKVNDYMTFLLFSVAFLAAVKFVGSTLYTILWLFQK